MRNNVISVSMGCCRAALVVLIAWAMLHMSVFAQEAAEKTEKAEPAYNVYFTGKAESGIPGNDVQTDFDCSEKVFLVLEIAGMEMGEHQLLVRWFDPRGKQEELTRYSFHYVGAGTRIWAWLRLSGPPGAAIGRVFDPSFGMGSFIGKWRAEILIDGKLIGEREFEVLC